MRHYEGDFSCHANTPSYILQRVGERCSTFNSFRAFKVTQDYSPIVGTTAQIGLPPDHDLFSVMKQSREMFPARMSKRGMMTILHKTTA